MNADAAASQASDGPPAGVIRNAPMGIQARLVGRAAPSAAARPAAEPDAVALALSRLGGTVPEAPSAAAPPMDQRAEREEELRNARAAAFEEGRLAGLEEQRRAMFEEALRQGLAEGRAAGEQESQRRLSSLQDQAMERLRRIDEIGAALPAQWREQFARRLDAAEDEMVGLCHAVICRFLGDSLASRAGVSQLMRTAIEQWLQASEKQSRGGPNVVRVHPADLDAMKADETLARWLVQQGVRGVEWQSGDDVALGGCIIHGTEGDLDARLETQLQNLHEQLLRGRARADTVVDAQALAQA